MTRTLFLSTCLPACLFSCSIFQFSALFYLFVFPVSVCVPSFGACVCCVCMYGCMCVCVCFVIRTRNLVLSGLAGDRHGAHLEEQHQPTYHGVSATEPVLSRSREDATRRGGGVMDVFFCWYHYSERSVFYWFFFRLLVLSEKLRFETINMKKVRHQHRSAPNFVF